MPRTTTTALTAVLISGVVAAVGAQALPASAAPTPVPVPTSAPTAKPAPAPAAKVSGSTLTLRTAHTTVAPKAKDTLTGQLAASRKPLAGQTVQLEDRAAGTTTFKVVAKATTNAKGQVTFTVVPGSKKGHKEQYELVFKGNKTHRGSHSGVVTVTVS